MLITSNSELGKIWDNKYSDGYQYRGGRPIGQQLADGPICIQLDKNDWTAEDKHVGCDPLVWSFWFSEFQKKKKTECLFMVRELG